MGVIKKSSNSAVNSIKNRPGRKLKSRPTDLPGPSSVGEAPTLNEDTTVNKKRSGGTISEGTPAKVPAVAASTTTGTVDMSSLPGTAKGMADIGGEDNSTMVYEIDRPLTVFSPRMNTYKKVHKFMTFGIAPNIIPSNEGTTPILATSAFLTTYMAEIPWHIPALYMNPSEFFLLQRGSRCVRCHVEVYYRGTTIQFETAATSTNLATLNQINDIAVAHGLNKSGQGQNVSFTGFATGQTMIPTAIAKPKYDSVGTNYRGMLRDYYGTPNEEGANFINYIPHHQLGRQTFLYNYWALSAIRNSTSTTVSRHQFGGWPTLSDKIEQYDGKTAVNTCVLTAEYKPKMGFLNRPHANMGHGLPASNTQATAITVQCGGHLPNNRQAQITPIQSPIATNAQLTGVTESVATSLNNLSTGGNLPATLNEYTPIEKSQFARTGSWGEMDPHVQPSIHIGVQPVPALTTTNTLTSSSGDGTWTDVRAYWEVMCTMDVVEHTPTAYPWAQTANVPVGDVIYFNDTAHVPAINLDPRDDGATWQGLYTNIAPTIGTDLA